MKLHSNSQQILETSQDVTIFIHQGYDMVGFTFRFFDFWFCFEMWKSLFPLHDLIIGAASLFPVLQEVIYAWSLYEEGTCTAILTIHAIYFPTVWWKLPWLACTPLVKGNTAIRCHIMYNACPHLVFKYVCLSM